MLALAPPLSTGLLEIMLEAVDACFACERCGHSVGYARSWRATTHFRSATASPLPAAVRDCSVSSRGARSASAVSEPAPTRLPSAIHT